MRKIAVSFMLCLAGAAWSPAGAQVAAPAPSAGAQPTATAPRALPRVSLVATGGTISNRRGGRLTADELVASVPGLADVATVQAEQFANVGSSQITLAQWLTLSQRLNALLRDDP